MSSETSTPTTRVARGAAVPCRSSPYHRRGPEQRDLLRRQELGNRGKFNVPSEGYLDERPIILSNNVGAIRVAHARGLRSHTVNTGLPSRTKGSSFAPSSGVRVVNCRGRFGTGLPRSARSQAEPWRAQKAVALSIETRRLSPIRPLPGSVGSSYPRTSRHGGCRGRRHLRSRSFRSFARSIPCKEGRRGRQRQLQEPARAMRANRRR